MPGAGHKDKAEDGSELLITVPARAGTSAQGRYPDGVTAREVRTSPGLWAPGRNSQEGMGLSTKASCEKTPALSPGTNRIKQLEFFPDRVETGDCYHAWDTCSTNPSIFVRHVDGGAVGLTPFY